MNKSVKRIGCLALSAMLAFPVVGCKSGSLDPEKDALVFATDALDGNFNPFFATSATDSSIAAMTQIGMLTTDEKGNPVCGEDQATVVLDYKQTMLNTAGEATDNAEQAKFTEYEFIIKNGIKFSDGVDLTIKDVLFNLYVYLDPMYMGSATIYSTDIVGLKAYRTQDPDVNEDTSESELKRTFYNAADARIEDMRSHLDGDNDTVVLDQEQVDKDVAKVKELFREEVESDWTMNAGSLEAYEDKYTFTEDWQVYYFNEGIITVQRDNTGKPKKDANDKYLTSLDDPNNELALEIANAKSNETTISQYMTEKGCTREEAQEYIVQDFAIDVVYETYTGSNSGLLQVINYWATGSNARDEFASEEMSDYYEEKKTQGGLAVPTITGITTGTTSSDYKGQSLGETHSVLKIKINGVDPKAIWNFAFAVAPMHYYSNKTLTDAADGQTNFGVSYADKEFFDTVIKNDDKNGKPVGAGIYMASNEKGSEVKTTKDNFYRNNWVYFERNPYFETVGESLHNANIKYLRYKVVGSDKLVQSLSTGEIHYGMPNATTDNMAELDKNKISHKEYDTNGYGYVGVNPKYVPDIEVRQAIMKSMETTMIEANYYKGGLAETIYRPMSILSWAYPDGVSEHESVKFTTQKSEIKALVESADWVMGEDGVYVKDGKRLELVFTIAGETTDHPAHTMFLEAAEFLNSCGFDVSVTTDITALKKLATGGLQVWAAAWSSTIDPDMYQVYHKDSNATSVKNWGYPEILNDSTGQFSDEKLIIDELSELIEQGRETIDQDVRKGIYAQALDKVMELAVELPTYQRKDMAAYNSNIIDSDTLNQTPSANAGLTDRLWEVNFVGGASGGDSNTGLIIGIVVGAVALIGGGAAAFVILKRRKVSDVIELDDEEDDKELDVEEDDEDEENESEE